MKVVLESLSGCAGCEIAILDLHERLLDLLNRIELAYAPIILDSKTFGKSDIGIVTGSVRSDEDVQKVRALRDRCTTLVTLGSCSCFGGVPGLANLFPPDSIARQSHEVNVASGSKMGEREDVPKLEKWVIPVDDLVKVEAKIPGCPPPPKFIAEQLTTLLNGGPQRLSKKTVCDECDLQKEIKRIDRIRRWGEGKIDFSKCFLEQGYICMGVATRAGCEARCIKAGTPCRGCFGPAEKIKDAGAKLISVIASTASLDSPEAMSPQELAESFIDVVGTAYRFTLASSIIRKRAFEEATH